MTLHRFIVELDVDERELHRYYDSPPAGLCMLDLDVESWNVGQLEEAVSQDVAREISTAPLTLVMADGVEEPPPAGRQPA